MNPRPSGCNLLLQVQQKIGGPIQEFNFLKKVFESFAHQATFPS
jgi:hypothetical protein